MNNQVLSMVAIVLGAILICWGISYFLFPLTFILSGIVLLKYGLTLRRTPISQYIFRFMNYR